MVSSRKNMKLAPLSVTVGRISYGAIAVTHILCGYTVAWVGAAYKLCFDEGLGNHSRIREAAYLPPWTYDAVLYSTSSAPILVGFIVGLGALGLFLYLENGDAKRKAWIPTCLTIALLIGFLPLIAMFWAFSLPFS
jgi:hypothetical protein